jgi:hypothetical protein
MNGCTLMFGIGHGELLIIGVVVACWLTRSLRR